MPPVVNLIWPQDGMAVSGTNLTIRGTMSDETGTIKLIDPTGTLVAKTAKGLQFGLPLTSQQIIDWNSEMMARRWRSRLLMICPSQSRMVGVFSIPEMFEIKQAGEYTLHVRMRLIINMQCAWLPEAIGKVLIRPEDILPLRSPHVGGTNISAK